MELWFPSNDHSYIFNHKPHPSAITAPPSPQHLHPSPPLPLFATYPPLPQHASPFFSPQAGRRSSLITNKENPFGAAVCCFCPPPPTPLPPEPDSQEGKRNAPHLFPFQLCPFSSPPLGFSQSVPHDLLASLLRRARNTTFGPEL